MVIVTTIAVVLVIAVRQHRANQIKKYIALADNARQQAWMIKSEIYHPKFDQRSQITREIAVHDTPTAKTRNSSIELASGIHTQFELMQQTIDERTRLRNKATSTSHIRTLFNPISSDWAAITNPESVTVLEVIEYSDNEKLLDDKMLKNLRRFTNLETLILNCKLTDDSFKQISTLEKLRALVIYNGGISDRGIKHLNKLRLVEAIGFFESDTSPNVAAQIKAELPDVYVQIGFFGNEKRGKILDGSGCLTPEFRRKYYHK